MDLCFWHLKCVWSRGPDENVGTSEKASQNFGQHSGGGCIFPIMY